MIDIVEIPTDGRDIGLQDTAVGRGANLVSVQIGSLEYAKDWGVDLRYFLNSQFQFQNESFKAYLVDRLTQHGINVSDVIDVLHTLYQTQTFFVDDGKTDAGGLIR